MRETTLEFSHVSYKYEARAEHLFDGLSCACGPGWTGIVGPNGVGKTTLLALACGLLVPSGGLVRAPQPALLAAQVPVAVPEGLDDLLASATVDDLALLADFGVGYDWPWRWETLSGGEKKRAQIAAVLHARPALLALDEPSNHLDARSRDLLIRGLEAFSGIGLLVSHDRELLDRLTVRTLFLGHDGVELRSGPYSPAHAERERCRKADETRARALQGEIVRLTARRNQQSGEAAAAGSRLSKRGLARHDHDGRARLDLARLSAKDRSAARAAARLETRIEHHRHELRGITRVGQRKQGVTVAASVNFSGFLLVREASRLPLGDERQLAVPDLVVSATDRIWISGDNGSGKSTLLRELAEALQARCGSALFYLPQELPEAAAGETLGRLADLPADTRGRVLSFFFRLGSAPDACLEGGRLSPGELRKLLLAEAFVGGAGCLVLDEPTNHMDLVSLHCVEEALAAYGGACILVTHDAAFAAAVGFSRHWQTRRCDSGSELVCG